ncbi:MAG: DHHW family protein [Firmicutes bacterium]|nr:DHHW family protein [Bacillota bacterium]
MNQQKPPLHIVLTAVIFILLLGGLALANLLAPNPSVLTSERRRPASFPALTVQTVTGGEFMTGFESYSADNFVLRDSFRTLRAVTVLDVFLQTDKSGLYRWNGGAGSFQAVNETEFTRSAQRLDRVAAQLTGLHVYYAAIPDKSIYTGRFFPGYDPEKAARILGASLPSLTSIDLTPALALGDYYNTDLHWDQTRLQGVLDTLGASMRFPPPDLSAFTVRTVGNFQGVYTGQIALPLRPDVMTCLTGGAMDELQVRYLDPRTLEFDPGPVYDDTAFLGRDPYDFFLRGAQPVIEIINPNAENDHTLYLFRDSFGSSLGPLFACGPYAKVVLIDLRYINSALLLQLQKFEPGADALFLLSSQVLNNSSILMVN